MVTPQTEYKMSFGINPIPAPLFDEQGSPQINSALKSGTPSRKKK
jgi:hypothetical protein